MDGYENEMLASEYFFKPSALVELLCDGPVAIIIPITIKVISIIVPITILLSLIISIVLCSFSFFLNYWFVFEDILLHRSFLL